MTIHRTAGEGRDHVYFSLPLLPAHKHLDINLQVCDHNDYHVFSIAAHANATLLLNEIQPPLGIYFLIKR